MRDARDAHVVLEAVRRRILPLITRRMGGPERDMLASGNVFVWQEDDNDGGLLRWTDGRRWSQSRMRGDYLFYEEKVETTQEERESKAARRARRVADPATPLPPVTRRRDRPTKPDGLTKQTYSAVVNLPGSHRPRKWHLVSYIRGDDFRRLPVIDNYAYLRDIQVPQNVFQSTKLCNRGERASSFSDTEDTSSVPQSPVSLQSERLRCAALPISDPPQSATREARSSCAPYSPVSERTRREQVLLPPLVGPRRTDGRYAPLTMEDRRALDRFHLGL
ncbi:Gti1/Pac2 family-domain-containing protein [Schizophyllum amplum]|uniref:Gti1/Pac2 family-domain-containing protein n=1 Tax=Schizophyllum amplum TaxID=97359 RepID=A0A550CXI3_9AGAR|nr:Gti1/Pac2 family-domain-containing protein [Auriculariopsis ampla]